MNGGKRKVTVDKLNFVAVFRTQGVEGVVAEAFAKRALEITELNRPELVQRIVALIQHLPMLRQIFAYI